VTNSQSGFERAGGRHHGSDAAHLYGPINYDLGQLDDPDAEIHEADEG
jgi:hypothetical protein